MMKKIKKILGDIAAVLGLFMLYSALKEADDHTQVMWGFVILGVIILLYLDSIRTHISHKIETLRQIAPFYECVFTKDFIYAHDFDTAAQFQLFIDTSLEFIPQIGMRISAIGDDGEDIHTGKITDMEYSYGTYYCQTEPFKIKAHDETMQAIANHEILGWKIRYADSELQEEYQLWKKTNTSTELN